MVTVSFNKSGRWLPCCCFFAVPCCKPVQFNSFFSTKGKSLNPASASGCEAAFFTFPSWLALLRFAETVQNVTCGQVLVTPVLWGEHFSSSSQVVQWMSHSKPFSFQCLLHVPLKSGATGWISLWWFRLSEFSVQTAALRCTSNVSSGNGPVLISGCTLENCCVFDVYLSLDPFSLFPWSGSSRGLAE